MGVHLTPADRNLVGTFCLRFPLFTLEKLTLPSWYLWLYSVKTVQTLYICAFHPQSLKSLWIQPGGILLPVLYAAWVVTYAGFSMQIKEMAWAPWFYKPIPQGTWLNSFNYYLNIYSYLSQWMWLHRFLLIVLSQIKQIKMSESEFLRDWHSRTMLHVRYVTSGYWKVHVNNCYSQASPFGCLILEINM